MPGTSQVEADQPTVTRRNDLPRQLPRAMGPVRPTAGSSGSPSMCSTVVRTSDVTVPMRRPPSLSPCSYSSMSGNATDHSGHTSPVPTRTVAVKRSLPPVTKSML